MGFGEGRSCARLTWDGKEIDVTAYEPLARSVHIAGECANTYLLDGVECVTVYFTNGVEDQTRAELFGMELTVLVPLLVV